MRTFPPKQGAMVVYESHAGDGITSPALILRTRETTVDSPLSSLADGWVNSDMTGTPIKAKLGEDEVDLLVFGLVQTYREFSVRYSENLLPRTWSYSE